MSNIDSWKLSTSSLMYLSVWKWETWTNVGKGQRLTFVVFFYCSPHYFLRQYFFMSLESTSRLNSLASKLLVSTCPQPSPRRAPPQPAFHMSAGDPNSGLHACAAIILPTEPASNTQASFFLRPPHILLWHLATFKQFSKHSTQILAGTAEDLSFPSTKRTPTKSSTVDLRNAHYKVLCWSWTCHPSM